MPRIEILASSGSHPKLNAKQLKSFARRAPVKMSLDNHVLSACSIQSSKWQSLSDCNEITRKLKNGLPLIKTHKILLQNFSNEFRKALIPASGAQRSQPLSFVICSALPPLALTCHSDCLPSRAWQKPLPQICSIWPYQQQAQASPSHLSCQPHQELSQET